MKITNDPFIIDNCSFESKYVKFAYYILSQKNMSRQTCSGMSCNDCFLYKDNLTPSTNLKIDKCVLYSMYEILGERDMILFSLASLWYDKYLLENLHKEYNQDNIYLQLYIIFDCKWTYIESHDIEFLIKESIMKLYCCEDDYKDVPGFYPELLKEGYKHILNGDLYLSL